MYEFLNSLRICARSPCGLDGVAGTLLAFRLLVDEFVSFCSRSAFILSVSISRSVRPVYLNLVPQEKNPPPEMTAACWLLARLKNRCNNNNIRIIKTTLY